MAGASILLVEDDFLLLIELEAVVRDAGAVTVCSCRTVGEAIAALDRCKIAVAVLDVRIGPDTVAPVARKLAEHGMPFLFYTGQMAGDRVISQWPDQPVLAKPTHPDLIVRTLADLLHRRPTLNGGAA